MPITANQSTVMIAPGANSGTVTIRWNFPIEIQLWERIYKVGSTAPFVHRDILDSQLMAGTYSQSLRSGDVYEVHAFDRDFMVAWKEEGQVIERTMGHIVVHALQLPSALQTDSNMKVGGTFFRYQIATGSTLTHAIMQIGKNRPVIDAAGFRSMADPLLTVESYVPATNHELTTDNITNMLTDQRTELLTEANFALISVFDGSGGWQQVEERFETLARRMTIDLHTIDVQSRGEAPSETEAEMRFRLEVWDFDGVNWRIIQPFGFENHHATLTPFAVRNAVSNPVVVIGPRRIRKETPGLALHVHEFDPWPFEDEDASSMTLGKPMAIRVTPGEYFENKTLHIRVNAAQPYDFFDTEDEISVDLLATVTVEHV